MITYLEGDATLSQVAGNKILCHVNNSVGGWGRGFVLALSKRWKEPEAAYREWYKNRANNDFALGAVQFVRVGDDTEVANMVGQKGIYSEDGIPPIRYEAVRACLKTVCLHAKANNATIIAPRFGSSLAGGDWKLIEKIINEELIDNGVDVVIYNFTPKHFSRLSIQ